MSRSLKGSKIAAGMQQQRSKNRFACTFRVPSSQPTLMTSYVSAHYRTANIYICEVPSRDGDI